MVLFPVTLRYIFDNKTASNETDMGRFFLLPFCMIFPAVNLHPFGSRGPVHGLPGISRPGTGEDGTEDAGKRDLAGRLRETGISRRGGRMNLNHDR